MAMLLMKQWELAVLRVSLDVSARAPAILSELIAYPGGEEELYWSHRSDLAAFGLPSGADPPDELHLPAGFSDELRGAVRGNVPTGAPLWLRLVPPYGYLGAVPWEDLVSAIGASLVRVPDRMPVPWDNRSSWSVALIVCAVPDQDWGAAHVRNFVSSLRERFSALEVHVFADVATYVRLTRSSDNLSGPDVQIHAPGRAVGAYAERNGSARSTADVLWADWIADGLAGRAVQAVHIAVAGAFDVDRPVLVVSPDPGNETRSWESRYVSAGEVQRLANSLGASLVSVVSPSGQRSDVAVRMIADNIGATRPGPTFYSSMASDPVSGVLADAHSFVAGVQPEPRVPQDGSLFCYLQPESVSQRWQSVVEQSVYPEADLVGAPSTPGSASESSIFESYGASDDVPTWIASSSCVIDSRRADLARTAEIPGERSGTKKAYDDGIQSALSDIQQLIARHAGRS